MGGSRETNCKQLEPYGLNIPGWMSKEELMWISETVSCLPPKSLIVELGVLVGRTSLAICLAAEQKVVVCIDKFGGFDVPNISGDGVRGVSDLLPEFLSNVGSAGVEITETHSRPEPPGCYYMIADSVEAAPVFGRASISFLFEDSDHARVGQIIDSWRPKMARGGIMAGHDYLKHGDWEFVSDQIDVRFPVSNPVGSIWVAEL